MSDLESYIDFNSVQCLNQCDDKHVINALKAGVREADESVLQSDADEQLLIYIPFRETVKIQTITIRSPPDGSGPCTVKVFKDVPNGAMDFDDADSATPDQEFDFSPQELAGEAKQVKFVAFQNTNSLTLFVESNHAGVDETVIQSIAVAGTTKQGTNMSELKKC